MDAIKRKTLEGWVEKAWSQLQAANDALKTRCRASDSIQASQQCVELSVKAILAYLGVEYPRAHGWDKDQFAKIARQIQERRLLEKLAAENVHIRLPRLLFLANFWDQFYLQAKYGLEAGYLAPAQELFDNEDAELAARHAQECIAAANQVRCLPDARLTAVAT